jgi:predicted RNA-binding Zn-ribbon protein involved in translation (DUF1610 family)
MIEVALVMFCGYCGKDISLDFKLCPYCGTLVEKYSIKPQATEFKQRPTSCTRCAAPLNVSLEEVIVTCRYCGNTIIVATHEEIKKHSMFENHLYPQEAVEAAKGYMDEGVFRRGIVDDAQITNVKLMYVPFWVFPN